MEIKIRNLSSALVSEMDRIASNQKISREEYLRRLIEKDVAFVSKTNALDNENRVRLLLAQQLEKNNILLPMLIEYLEVNNGN